MTNAQGSFGVSSTSKEIRLDQDVRRSNGHVIKYSVRPRVFDPDPGGDHYAVTDLLSLSFPRKSMLFSTHMSRTGWGIRCLTEEELALCFELPEYVSRNDRYIRDIIQLQLCRSVVDSFTEACSPEPPRVRLKTSHGSFFDSKTSLSDVEWLPSVQRWLDAWCLG